MRVARREAPGALHWHKTSGALEARILKTVRAKPSEIGILLPQQANHYHIPPNGARFGMSRPSARFELVINH
jgi:hypothetical protein